MFYLCSLFPEFVTEDCWVFLGGGGGLCSPLPHWKLRQERICLQWKRLKFDPGSGRSPGEGKGNPLQYSCLEVVWGFPGGSVVKYPLANVGDAGHLASISGSGRSPEGVNGNPLQYCLENPIDRRAWWATVHRVTKTWAWLSNWVHTHTHTPNFTRCNNFMYDSFFLMLSSKNFSLMRSVLKLRLELVSSSRTSD